MSRARGKRRRREERVVEQVKVGEEEEEKDEVEAIFAASCFSHFLFGLPLPACAGRDKLNAVPFFAGKRYLRTFLGKRVPVAVSGPKRYNFGSL